MDTFREHPVRIAQVSIGSRRFHVLMPAAPELLLDEPRTAERFRENEYIPYWAQLWPGARMLAAHVVARVADHSVRRGARTLELGCGLGLTGIVAADLGLDVTLSDYDEDALAFATRSAALNGIANLRALVLDWTLAPAEVARILGAGRFDLILAADALYEARNHVPLARCIATLLASEGVAWLSDPGRSVADAFPHAAAGVGLSCESVPVTVEGDAEVIKGRIFVVRRAVN